MIDWNEVKKDIKELLNKNTHVDMLSFVHGIEPTPLCFTTEKEYDNFINKLMKYIKNLYQNQLITEIRYSQIPEKSEITE